MRRTAIGMACVVLMAVALTFMLPTLPPLAGDGRPDAIWEKRNLGVDFRSVLKQEALAFFFGSRYTVTCLLPLHDQGRLYIGTGDGVLICKQDGSIERHLRMKRSTSVPGHGQDAEDAAREGDDEDDHEEEDDGYTERSLAHSIVTAMIPLRNGTIWVRMLWGSAVLSRTGQLIEECESDKLTVERHHRLILKEPGLQKYFPVRNGTVYLPLAGHSVAGYDGQKWRFVRQLPREGGVRRIHVIKGDLYAAGSGGLIRVNDGTYVIRPYHVAVQPISGRMWLCVGGWNVWLFDGDKAEKIGTGGPGEDIVIYTRFPGKVIWSGYEDGSIHILDLAKRGNSRLRSLRLPSGHRWRGFVRTAGPGWTSGEKIPTTLPGASRYLYVLTSRGIVQTDLKTSKVLVRIETPKLALLRWRALTAHGVHVWAAARMGQDILIGTGVGLARYDPRSTKVTWVWKVAE